MAEQVSDFVLGRMREWGVHRVFAYPGDGINGILGAFGRAEGDPGAHYQQEVALDRLFADVSEFCQVVMSSWRAASTSGGRCRGSRR